MHLGHARSAYEAFSAADREQGTCFLRIEDIDQTRCRPEFEAAIFEDLAWLGFSWPQPVRRQSDHFDSYEKALKRLDDMGLVYRCFLTRRELEAELEARGIETSPAGERPYPGPRAAMSADELQSRIGKGEAFAWRLSLDRARDYLGDAFHTLMFVEEGYLEYRKTTEEKAHPDWLGDVVLARKDSPTSYHLAVCHDDNLQQISHVIRGADLYHATHIHVLIQALMGWPTPVYTHHELVLDDQQNKLSKSRGSETLRKLREDGVRPETLIARWAG